MAITIKGIRIGDITIKRDGEDEETSGVTCNYSLISSVDKVLAKQTVGGYNGLKIQPSADTLGAMDKFLVLYRRDIETTLGLNTD